MNRQPSFTAGILYCGDLGSAVANLLRGDNVRVVTTCENRSARTRRQAEASGCEVLESLDDVIRESDLLISLVVPDAALPLARDVLARQSLARRGALYLDANAISPGALESIITEFAMAKLELVDGAFRGSAHRLREVGSLYLSGSRSAEVERIFQPLLPVRVLGDQPGLASRLKNIIGCFSKSLSGLYLELGMLAEKSGILESFRTELRDFFPEIDAAMERTLPTYPQHVARRIQELRAAEELGTQLGCPLAIAGAVREWFQESEERFHSLNAMMNQLSTDDLISGMIQHLAAGATVPSELSRK